jgi:hypothetical protein
MLSSEQRSSVVKMGMVPGQQSKDRKMELKPRLKVNNVYFIYWFLSKKKYIQQTITWQQEVDQAPLRHACNGLQGRHDTVPAMRDTLYDER